MRFKDARHRPNGSQQSQRASPKPSTKVSQCCPKINFDDHKLFKGTTNEFLILGEYFSVVSGSPKMLSLKNFFKGAKVEDFASWRYF